MRAYVAATFRSLRHRAYRLYFTGQLISTIGTWAQKVAQAWLVLHLTGSGTLLGITTGLQQLPTLLLTSWGGSLADRFNRRTVLLWTNTCAVLPAAILGILAHLDRATVPVIMVLAVASGIADAFDKPARHTLAADIVPTEDITNAVALNSTMFNAGKVVGPAAAGLVIGVAGVPMTFLLNALSFVVMIVALLRIRPGDIRARDVAPKQTGALLAGLDHARRTPIIAAVLAVMTITGLVAYDWNTVIPLLARDYSTDASTIGFLFAAMGTGAIVGSLSLAGVLVAAPRTFLAAGMAFAVVLGLVAASPTMTVTLLAMFALGAVSTTFRALATSLIQLTSEPALRGRTVSLLIIAINGTSTISGPLIGATAEQLGARTTVALGAAISLLAGWGAWRYLARVTPTAVRRITDRDLA